MKKNYLALTFLGLVAIIASVGLVLEGTGSLNPTGEVELTGNVITDPAVCTPAVARGQHVWGACCDKNGGCKDTTEASCPMWGIKWIKGASCPWFGKGPCA